MTGFKSSHFRHKCSEKGCYIEQLPNWDEYIDCFPGRIRPTDVDGMVEINGSFLFLEEKGKCVSMEPGQNLALRRLARLPMVTVVVFRPGRASDLEVLVFDGGDNDGFKPRTSDWFKQWLRAWAKTADEREAV